MVAASRLAIACTMLLAAAPGSAQERDEPAPPDFVNARVDEDYAYLRDSSRRSGSWWESFKFIPIANEGRLTLGGDLRLRYERYRNNLWGGADQPNDAYGLMRLMSHADLQLGSNLRLFGQLIGAWSAGVEPSPGPVDETRFDLLQSFARVGVPITVGACSSKAGGSLTRRRWLRHPALSSSENRASGDRPSAFPRHGSATPVSLQWPDQAAITRCRVAKVVSQSALFNFSCDEAGIGLSSSASRTCRSILLFATTSPTAALISRLSLGSFPIINSLRSAKRWRAVSVPFRSTAI
ncbi:alginate export family protein [Bosea sp. (in: a-proteobacteria)]|jgi:hypothetical protein|uniref:alginate export family protein n=1 Tax=Bosea sp. (in: a-proteobacteria) TaxID=1871050 RepID=UPI0030187724